MEKHIKWWSKLNERTKWNLSINYINHYKLLNDECILEIYKTHH